MTTLKVRRTKDIIIIFIILMTLLEVYFAYKLLKDYKGIYNVWIFFPFIFVSLSYIRSSKKEVTDNKSSLLLLAIIS